MSEPKPISLEPDVKKVRQLLIDIKKKYFGSPVEEFAPLILESNEWLSMNDSERIVFLLLLQGMISK